MAYLGATDPEPLQRDWRCLWEAGHGFNHGRWDDLYAKWFNPNDHSGICQAGYFWLYPPYALYPVAILAFFPLQWAYSVVLIGVYGCFALSMVLMGRLYPNNTSSVNVFALGVLASAPMCSVVVTGQNSAWLLLAMTAGIVALHAKNWLLAGLCFAVFGLKPNWLPLLLLWLVLQREWRTFAMISATGILMVISTLPLGFDLWRSFQTSSLGYGEYVLQNYPVDKLITIHAALRMLPGVEGSSLVALWGLGVGIGLWAAFATWYAQRSIAAQASVVVLVTVACNVYTNFYDALLLCLPAAIWWFEREHYKPLIWRSVAALIGVGWLWMWVHFYGSRGGTPGHLGFILLAWIILEGMQSTIQQRSDG